MAAKRRLSYIPSSRRRRQRSSILSMKPWPSDERDPCAGFGADPAPAGIGAVADVLPGVDGGHRSGDHDHESENAEEDQILPADSQDEQSQSGEEADAGEGGPPPVHPASAGAAHGVDQLRVLGCERSLHLLEKPLLLIREGHWPPPMGLVVLRCRSSRVGRSSLSLGWLGERSETQSGNLHGERGRAGAATSCWVRTSRCTAAGPNRDTAASTAWSASRQPRSGSVSRGWR